MAENPNTLGHYEEQPTNQEVTYTPGQVRNRRVLFWLGVFVWVVILMIPFAVFMLSILGEISFAAPGDYPGNEVRIWMVMERDERGIAYSRPVVAERTEENLLVQTTVRYLLWEGDNEHIHYCQTYDRGAAAEIWQAVDTTEGKCS